MHALDWLREANPQGARPVYAVFGGDHYLVRESITAVSRVLFPGADDEPAVTRFAGESRRWPTYWMSSSLCRSSAVAGW